MANNMQRLLPLNPARRLVVDPRLHRPLARSLALKLTLAFLCVGLLGALLVAFFVGQRTQAAFGQFVDDRDHAIAVTELTRYYQKHHSWAGIATVVQTAPLAAASDDSDTISLTLAQPDGRVVVGNGRFRAATVVSSDALSGATPITVGGETVGLLFSDTATSQQVAGTLETTFLQRVTQASIYGAVGATTVALLLGMVLARTLTRPLRELTVATKALAQGSLGQHVVVRSRDELGALASAFNKMSSDLAQSSMQRRQMTADIAHDLRTPLSVILGYTEGLREGKLPPDQDTFETMYTEAQHLHHLIDDLRTLSLADTGELSVQRREVEPQALIERALAASAAAAQKQGIELGARTAPNLPLLQVDVERMAQVFGNLLSNALRYTPSGGTIRLSAEAYAGSIQFRVEDTGAGIAAEALPHVFDRFYRADASRQQDGSSGLGLAIVKSIVEAHGGTITVESAVGQGSTFTISLPASMVSSPMAAAGATR
jgi:two-component system, OmpR family, sensor histidine kinase BaeS